MDAGSSRKNALEIILNDPDARPCGLPLQYLREITNDFSSEQELGRGGFGVVYKGMLPNGEMVAVKTLLPMLQCQEKQFKYEVDNLMRVRHQNIVRFVGYCYETRHKYIEYNGRHVFAEKPKMVLCFEYMPNGSLDKYISEESHGLDWHKRYKIIKGICCGLYYLHNECQIKGSVIHMDLKPANILLDNNMMPKIADFGLAKLLDEKITQTCATTLMVSRGYTAPEYLFEGIISRQADIYSLGVIIVQMVTGRRVSPYDNVSLCQDFVELVVQNWRNRIDGAPSETDCKQIKGCLEICLMCIKMNRKERPTMKEIIEMLSIWEHTHCYVREEEMPAANQSTNSHLKEIDFTDRDIDDEALKHLASCSELQILKLGATTPPVPSRISNKGLFYIGSNCGKLVELDLYRCSAITDEGLAALVHCKRIRMLNLSYCTKITDAGLGHLSALEELTHLEMRCLVRVTGIGITSIVIGCTRLIELDLKRCYSVDDAGLSALARHAKNLRQLTISYCQVTGLALCHLLSSLRCLQDVKLVHLSWVAIEAYNMALRASCGRLKKLKLLSGLRFVLSPELLQMLQAGGCHLRWVDKPLVYK